MIRTRDFLILSFVLFVFVGIGMTAIFDLPRYDNNYATAIKSDIQFDTDVRSKEVEIAEVPSVPRADNIERLRNKIAAGHGDIDRGNPVFTSVDDLIPEDEDVEVITDQSDPTTFLVGHDMAEQPLMSGDLWRFFGFGANDQIGVAVNGLPIFGSRTDNYVLDMCGGVDEGLGYRYYLDLSKDLSADCFSR